MKNQQLVKTLMLGMVQANQHWRILARRRSDNTTDCCSCTMSETVHLANDGQGHRTYWSQWFTSSNNNYTPLMHCVC